MDKNGGGFWDNPFGGLFDFDQDGKEDFAELGIGFGILEEIDKEDSLSDDCDLDDDCDIDDDPDFSADDSDDPDDSDNSDNDSGYSDSISAPKGARSRSATRSDQWGLGAKAPSKQRRPSAQRALVCLACKLVPINIGVSQEVSLNGGI